MHTQDKRRAVDDNGKPIGIMNENILNYSKTYELEYADGVS